MESGYVTYHKKTLVAMAKDRGISHRGNIADIVARLVADDNENSRHIRQADSHHTPQGTEQHSHVASTPHRRSRRSPGFESRGINHEGSLLELNVSGFSETSSSSRKSVSNAHAARAIKDAREALRVLEQELENPDTSRALLPPCLQ